MERSSLEVTELQKTILHTKKKKKLLKEENLVEVSSIDQAKSAVAESSDAEAPDGLNAGQDAAQDSVRSDGGVESAKGNDQLAEHRATADGDAATSDADAAQKDLNVTKHSTEQPPANADTAQGRSNGNATLASNGTVCVDATSHVPCDDTLTRIVGSLSRFGVSLRLTNRWSSQSTMKLCHTNRQQQHPRIARKQRLLCHLPGRRTLKNLKQPRPALTMW